MPGPQPSNRPNMNIAQDLEKFRDAPHEAFQEAASAMIEIMLEKDRFEKMQRIQNTALEMCGISRVARGIIYNEGVRNVDQKDGKITSQNAWIEGPDVVAGIFMANHAIPGQLGSIQKQFRPVPFIRFEDRSLAKDGPRTLAIGKLVESGAVVPAEGFNHQDLTNILKMADTLRSARDSGELPHLHDNLNQLFFDQK